MDQAYVQYFLSYTVKLTKYSRHAQFSPLSHIPLVRALHARECKWKQVFLLFLSSLSQSERRLFILREQLKTQFKATQKAQINERKEADSKRRLTSCASCSCACIVYWLTIVVRYVFHDKCSTFLPFPDSPEIYRSECPWTQLVGVIRYRSVTSVDRASSPCRAEYGGIVCRI